MLNRKISHDLILYFFGRCLYQEVLKTRQMRIDEVRETEWRERQTTVEGKSWGEREQGRIKERDGVKGRWSVAEPCLEEKQTPEKTPKEWAKQKTSDKENWLLAVRVVYCCDRFGYDFEIFLYHFYSRKFHLNRAHQSSNRWRIQFLFQWRMKEETAKNRLIIVMLFVIFSTLNILIIMETIGEYMKIAFLQQVYAVVWVQSWAVQCSCNPKMNSHQW